MFETEQITLLPHQRGSPGPLMCTRLAHAQALGKKNVVNR